MYASLQFKIIIHYSRDGEGKWLFYRYRLTILIKIKIWGFSECVLKGVGGVSTGNACQLDNIGQELILAITKNTGSLEQILHCFLI